MTKHYVKGFGFIEENESTKEFLISKGIINDTPKQKRIESDSIDIVRVSKRRRTK